MVPNKEEPESDSELTEEDATQPEQPEEPAEPAVENAVAEEPAAEEALQHVVDAAELTKECVDRLVEENGAEKALAEVGKCRVVKLRNLAREYDSLQIAGREISKANKATLLEELKKLKKRGRVIIVSAKDSIEDKVTGLDLGADDYLAKPFHLAELHARVKSVIRRHQTDGNTKIEIENLTVCPDNHTVFINGEELKLNRKEFDLLYYFATNPNRLINKTTLAEAVWGDNIDQADSLDFIYSQVKNLRKKMKTAEATPEIKAVYGFGYKLITTPEA